MYTQLSIQHIASISAHAFLDLGSTPVTIRFESTETDGFSSSEIVLHLENKALAAALVEAINTAAKANQPVSAAEQAILEEV